MYKTRDLYFQNIYFKIKRNYYYIYKLKYQNKNINI